MRHCDSNLHTYSLIATGWCILVKKKVSSSEFYSKWAHLAGGTRDFFSVLLYKGITATACLFFQTLQKYNGLSVGTTAAAGCFIFTMHHSFLTMKCAFCSLRAVAELEAFVTLVRNDPNILHRPELAFFKDYLHSLGARIPSPPAEDEPEEPEVSQNSA